MLYLCGLEIKKSISKTIINLKNIFKEMKKVTLLALALSMTIGTFAQSLDLGNTRIPANIKQIPTPAGITVKSPVVKDGGVTVSDVVLTSETNGLFSATYSVSAAAGWKYALITIGAKGTLQNLANQYSMTIEDIAKLYVNSSTEIEWKEGDGQPVTETGFWGAKEWEIDLLGVNGSDTVAIQKFFATESSPKAGTAVATFDLDAKTETLNFSNFQFNDQTSIFFFFVDYKAQLDALIAQAKQQGQDWGYDQAALSTAQQVRAMQLVLLNPDEKAAENANKLFADGWLYDYAQNPKAWAIGDELVACAIPINGNSQLGTSDIKQFKVGSVSLQDAMNEGVLVNVYPNPASEYVQVIGINGMDKVELVNTLGQTVYSMNTPVNGLNIPVSNLGEGTYFVKVSNNGNVITKKVVIK